MEEGPQQIEVNMIEFKEYKSPFAHLKGQEIPQNYQTHFKIPGVGMAAFRLSNSLPGTSEKTAQSQRYIWAEIALDAHLSAKEVEHYRVNLDLEFIRHKDNEKYLALPDINEQGDRLKFNSVWLNQRDGRAIKPRKVNPFVLNCQELTGIEVILRDNRQRPITR